MAIVACGCNQLLDLKDVVQTATCTPLSFDAGRYRAKVDANGTGYTWPAARTACQFDGYDLAVFDEGDSNELTNEALAAQVPFWVGVSYNAGWRAIDDCQPDLGWAPSEPNSSTTGDCVAKGALGL